MINKVKKFFENVKKTVEVKWIWLMAGCSTPTPKGDESVQHVTSDQAVEMAQEALHHREQGQK